MIKFFKGGDVLLRLLLFWSLFLPLGQIWSTDVWRIKEPKPLLPRTTILASWALTLQICFVYWFAAFLKFDPSWIQSGNALFYALNIEHFTTSLGLYLRQFPDLLRVISWGTPWLELLGPCLLFIPFHRNACRLIAVCFFLTFHLIGIQALLRIGLFPQACTAAWLVFIPGSFWDWLRAGDRISTIKQSTKQHSGKKLKPKTSIVSITDRACVCVLLVAFLDVFMWNIVSVSGEACRRWMAEHDALASAVRLDQRWNMYAPHPRIDHGWLVVPADLANGTQVDLFTSQPISWEKPKDIGALFGDDRWRRYLSNLFDEQNPETLRHYADYLVRNWNERHGEGQKIEAVTITFMKQQTLPDLTVTDPEKDVLYFHAY